MEVYPQISVITVCRNSKKTIDRALSSVAMQDWPNIEHIVIDGASTDGTLEVLDRFKTRLSYVISEPDNGIYDAMNKGLAKANGEVVCFLNADDEYVSSTTLSRVMALIVDLNLDAVMGDVVYFDKDEPSRVLRRYRSNQFNPSRLAWGWMPAHPALFLRKRVTDRVGCFKTDYSIAGDYEYVIRAFYCQNLQYQHMSEILVRMQTGGASTGGILKKINLNLEVLRACRENGVSTNIFKILSKYPKKILEMIRK